MRIVRIAIRIVLGVVGLIIGIAVLGALFGDSDSASSGGGTAADRTVTMAEFDRLQTGMSYAEAVSIIGFEGTEVSRSDMAGVSTVMYDWVNPGFSGANMNAMFQDGALVSKAQAGLR